MAENLPFELLAFVAGSSLFAVAAAMKAVWHNSRLRAGGERPLGLFRNLLKDR